jgi:hypothetical protein
MLLVSVQKLVYNLIGRIAKHILVFDLCQCGHIAIVYPISHPHGSFMYYRSIIHGRDDQHRFFNIPGISDRVVKIFNQTLPV